MFISGIALLFAGFAMCLLADFESAAYWMGVATTGAGGFVAVAGALR